MKTRMINDHADALSKRTIDLAMETLFLRRMIKITLWRVTMILGFPNLLRNTFISESTFGILGTKLKNQDVFCSQTWLWE